MTSLAGSHDWNKQLAQITEWAAAGRVTHLLAIGTALTGDNQAFGLTPAVRQSLLGSLEKTLALTSGLDHAEAALIVLQMREAQKTREALRGPAPRQPSRRQHEAELASVLAQEQTSVTLADLFERHSTQQECLELLACLVQEMVQRGISITGPAAEFWTRIADTHPLDNLPLTLLPLENQFS